jgi:ATP-dependent helicase/nuclease subunit A
MTTVTIADSAERELARNPELSVIVQAPAGSGKTELLMQRYLALLAGANEPEEILAVTFTRKAAAEMRSRILKALWPSTGDKERLAETAELARQVLERNTECAWGLKEFPGRLRIRTLDSVNAWLTGTAPVSGEGTALGAVTERADEFYELAARRTLERLGDRGPADGQEQLPADIDTILGHLDNRADQFVSLMAEMLRRRDQWLPLLGTGELSAEARGLLEAGLRGLVGYQLELVDQMLGDSLRHELATVMAYAGGNLLAAGDAGPVTLWAERDAFPAADPEQITLWRGLGHFCLTKNVAEFRKPGGMNVKVGFPTAKAGGNDEIKKKAQALLEGFAGDEQLAAALHGLRAMPDPCYSEEQWAALQAMIRVLPIVAAELLIIFRERGETDYMELASEALNTLRDGDGPTDLALRLDYQIRHILIDEFQDTSVSQHSLLAALTDGWEQGDGRTLFVVGDPMQSIYRFRQAEVALFDQLREHGIGQIELTEVRLTTNFRSDAAIVKWVNDIFSQLMPPQNNPAVGAVQFAPGTAREIADETTGQAVVWHPAVYPARVDEARAVADVVEQALAESPDGDVGILVRTRNHARLLVPELRRRGIAFVGEGLEHPGETSVEQDLIALTRALCHTGDRTAWLAMLRAPWCGLTLADLEQLTGRDWNTAVWEQMSDAALTELLSDDGQQRVRQLRSTLAAVFNRRGSAHLRDWVEGAWQELGGPATLPSERDLQLAQQFFTVLDEYEQGGDIAEAFLLHEQLADRVDQEGDPTIRVHLLTLFKAKGLEYDTVILPALDGATRGDSKDAIAWHEFIGADGDKHFLLAPIEPVGAEADPLHSLIRQFKKEQANFELDRFLYVATTRAKHKLHLFFGLKRNSKDELSDPVSGTLLSRLWPVISANYADYAGQPGTPETRDDWVQPIIRRFPPGWSNLAAPAGIATARGPAPIEKDNEVTFDWAGSDAMRIGSVVHRCLQYIAERATEASTAIADNLPVEIMLREEGVAAGNLQPASSRVRAALLSALADETGQWILAKHNESACEYPVTVVADGRPQRLIIDRTFVDDAGVRWVIDYKTSSHEGGDLDGFIASETERYAEQLAAYSAAMTALRPDETIRTALYFPLLGVFRETTGATTGETNDATSV